MTMLKKPNNARPPIKRLKPDEALIALFIGAMNANDHVAREELARAHHLIWSTKRFRRKSGEAVGRLIDRMKRLIEEQEPAAVMEAAARGIPAKLRPSAFAIVADLLLADGKIDARERKFLRRLAVDFNIRARVASDVIDAMLVKNYL
jgi:tellurite resistance protein